MSAFFLQKCCDNTLFYCGDQVGWLADETQAFPFVDQAAAEAFDAAHHTCATAVAATQQVLTFTANGNFTVPAFTTVIDSVECWAGGGGGGSGNATQGGGGGGGGSYAKNVDIPAVPGTTTPVVVGVFGASGTFPDNNGSPGGASVLTVGSTLTAAQPGLGGKCINQSGTGGAGGDSTTSDGTTKFSGGTGGNCDGFAGGGGGGSSAGTASVGTPGNFNAMGTGGTGGGAPAGGGDGGDGGDAAAGGVDGIDPGGGGGGAGSLSNGGNGFAGKVVVTYTPGRTV